MYVQISDMGHLEKVDVSRRSREKKKSDNGIKTCSVDPVLVSVN